MKKQLLAVTDFFLYVRVIQLGMSLSMPLRFFYKIVCMDQLDISKQIMWGDQLNLFVSQTEMDIYILIS